MTTAHFIDNQKTVIPMRLANMIMTHVYVHISKSYSKIYYLKQKIELFMYIPMHIKEFRE